MIEPIRNAFYIPYVTEQTARGPDIGVLADASRVRVVVKEGEVAKDLDGAAQVRGQRSDVGSQTAGVRAGQSGL